MRVNRIGLSSIVLHVLFAKTVNSDHHIFAFVLCLLSLGLSLSLSHSSAACRSLRRASPIVIMVCSQLLKDEVSDVPNSRLLS